MTERPGAPPKSRAKWPLILAAVVAVVIVAVASAVELTPRVRLSPYSETSLTLEPAARSPSQEMSVITYPESYSEYGVGWFNVTFRSDAPVAVCASAFGANESLADCQAAATSNATASGESGAISAGAWGETGLIAESTSGAATTVRFEWWDNGTALFNSTIGTQARGSGSIAIPAGAYGFSYGCAAITLPSNGSVGDTLFSNATAPVEIGGEVSFSGLCASVPFTPSFGLSNVTAGVSPFGAVVGLGLNVLTVEVASLNPISVTVSLTVTLAQTHPVTV